MLSTASGGAPRAGVSPQQWWQEALHGIANNVGVSFNGATPASTSFPQPITSSCAFNRSLWRATGEAISTEVRAFANAGHAGLTMWSPNSASAVAAGGARWGGPRGAPRLTAPFPFLCSQHRARPAVGEDPGDARRRPFLVGSLRGKLRARHAGGRGRAVPQDVGLLQALRRLFTRKLARDGPLPLQRRRHGRGPRRHVSPRVPAMRRRRPRVVHHVQRALRFARTAREP